jgi:ZIP family zinc transporter
LRWRRIGTAAVERIMGKANRLAELRRTDKRKRGSASIDFTQARDVPSSAALIRRIAPVILGGVLLAAIGAALLADLAGARSGLSEPMRGALLGGCAATVATALGALPALFLRGISQRVEDLILGFAAGVMLAASAFSLIVPSIDAGEALLGGRTTAALLAALAIGAGALLMVGIERTLPHEHRQLGRHGRNAQWARVWLLVLAILIHNFPEGMAIGVGFSGADVSAGIPIATAIAIQDIPEGLVVALALRAIAYSPMRAVLIGAATGLAEPVGAVLANAVTGLTPALYPFGLALSAGAMLFVVSHEVIPETHRRGHQMPATLGVMGGFAVMMVLDNAFA